MLNLNNFNPAGNTANNTLIADQILTRNDNANGANKKTIGNNNNANGANVNWKNQNNAGLHLLRTGINTPNPKAGKNQLRNRHEVVFPADGVNEVLNLTNIPANHFAA